MYQVIYNFLKNMGMQGYNAITSYIITLIVIATLCVVIRFLVRYVVVKIVTKTSIKTKTKWDDILLERKFFHRLSNLSIPIVLNFAAFNSMQYGVAWKKIVDILTFVILGLILDSVINSIDQIYRSYEISKIKPIRGILQVAKVVLYIIGAIIIIALFIGESPMALLGGISAMTAVTSLIFKDAILGFVAGIQLSANDMVRIGDWIEMPKYSADGTVIDLSLTTVKVENFDHTITAIPAYALVSDAFINWRGMQTSGGRRIKRSIFIEVSGVRFCDDEMLNRFRKIYLLQDYINGKMKEIDSYNSVNQYDLSMPVNGRRLTNLGTFRAYIHEYLKKHPGIHKGMTLMVRQLSPTSTGIPIEIYAFTSTVDWVEYEGIQSDIFDHLHAIASEFGLTVFQQISGHDIRSNPISNDIMNERKIQESMIQEGKIVTKERNDYGMVENQ